MKLNYYIFCTSSGLNINESPAKQFPAAELILILERAVRAIDPSQLTTAFFSEINKNTVAENIELLEQLVREHGHDNYEYDEECEQCGHYSRDYELHI